MADKAVTAKVPTDRNAATTVASAAMDHAAETTKMVKVPVPDPMSKPDMSKESHAEPVTEETGIRGRLPVTTAGKSKAPVTATLKPAKEPAYRPMDPEPLPEGVPEGYQAAGFADLFSGDNTTDVWVLVAIISVIVILCQVLAVTRCIRSGKGPISDRSFLSQQHFSIADLFRDRRMGMVSINIGTAFMFRICNCKIVKILNEQSFFKY